MEDEKGTTIPTNLRLLVVLEEIARAGVPMTPTAVNDHLGLPKPTIHRLFATLEEESFLQRDLDGRSYAPGPRLRSLAGGVLSSLRIRTARQAILQKLSSTIKETCNVALPDRDAMIYIERVETEWPLRIQLPIGSRVPFYCTASGKLYLSTLASNHLRSYLDTIELQQYTSHTFCDPDALRRELKHIRQRGYSIDREEFMEDMVALAVPIMDRNDRLTATLSFHAPTQRFTVEQLLEHLPSLNEASRQMAALITE